MSKTVAPVFNLMDAIRAFYADAMDRQAHVLFLDLDRRSLIHPDPAFRARILAEHGMPAALTTCLNTAQERGQSLCTRLSDGRHVITINSKSLGGIFPPFFVFDHEIGHAVIADGTGPTVLSESIADAFAVLRHFQRFGTHSHLLDGLASLRACGMAMGDVLHFTSPVVARIIALKNEIDIERLTFAETADLARALARTWTADKGMQIYYQEGLKGVSSNGRLRVLSALIEHAPPRCRLPHVVIPRPCKR